MATPEKCVYVFTSKLGCKKELSDPVLDESEASSVLPCFLENEGSRCTFPSLNLGKCEQLTPSEEEAIAELKSPLEARKATISLAPTALLQNSCRSFGTMIDNRIKQLHLMILAGADGHGKAHQYNLKLSSLFCGNNNCPTSFISAESSFRPLPISKGFVKEVGRIKAVILPLVFKASITIDILGVKQHKVTITAPGTIVGSFLGSCTRLRTAEITLDTAAVYRSMKSRCDEVVNVTFKTAAQVLKMSSEQVEKRIMEDTENIGSKSPSTRPQSPLRINETRISRPVSP